MKTIDFLPQKYRDRSARRRAGVWRLLVAALLGGAVGLASLGQFVHHRRVRAQLDELQPQYADAQAKTAVLAQMQTDLMHETAAATLYAHLQIPWPRTQLVAALASAAGRDLRIEQLHLIETAAAPAVSEAASENLSAAPSLESMSPATRDLTAIRAEVAARSTSVEIIGASPQVDAIHAYLAKLGATPLVAHAELVSLENIAVEGKPRELRFTAQVKVRAAHGWTTSGEASPPPDAVTLTHSTPVAP